MTEAQELRLRPFLATCSGLRVGKETHCPLFLEALRWIARMDAPWHQWPAKYGKGNSVYRRWAHGCDQDGGSRRRAYRQANPDLSAVRRDRTVMRARIRAAGTLQKKGTDPARGRSQGGVSTQIHILTDRRGRPLGLRVTGGQRHDRTQARDLEEDGTDARPACLIKEAVLR